MANLLVGLAQLNFTVGDLAANTAKIIAAYRTAVADGAQMVVFSELAITGYPPEDLLLKDAFLRASAESLAEVAGATGAAVAIVGFPELAPGSPMPGSLAPGSPGVVYNSAAVCAGGQVQSIVRKRQLPNYAVFDEQRYFTAGKDPVQLFEVGGAAVGLSICEDIWEEPDVAGARAGTAAARADDGAASLAPVLAEQVEAGAQLLVCINGSPYQRGRQAERESHIAAQAQAAGTALIYVNQTGGQDELVFDGGSCVVGASAEMVARLGSFAEETKVVPVPVGEAASAGTAADKAAVAMPLPQSLVAPWPDPLAEIWQALVVATRDYVTKNGFSDVVIGTSGGVDSSLVTAIATDALDPQHVHAVSMPSRYSSDHSSTDAACLAQNLGVDYRSIEIEPAHGALLEMLDLGGSAGRPADSQPSASQAEVDLPEQNLQSRIRGVILMALSNRHNWLVLTTGNKTELSVGYSTLYGDTAGGYAVIKDCPKLLVYELCRWRNAQADGPWIPADVLTKPPSAELSPQQFDEDHLPPYELLDPLVESYVDGDLTTDQLIERAGTGQASADLVRRVTRLIDLAEYKRRQSPLGPRISGKSFGKDRRMPVTNRFS